MFPLSATEFTKYYLHSDGSANASNITDDHYDYKGVLSIEKPDGEILDKYTYDPSDPVVTNGGYNSHWQGGVTDRATTYHRREEEDIAVVGPITATLHTSTSAVDTDFVVTLSDVEIPARAGSLRVTEAARRGASVMSAPTHASRRRTFRSIPSNLGRYISGRSPSGRPRVFEKSHRIRIDVTSSDFLRYSRNPNTGEELTGTEMVEADQTIYHDQERPSNIEFPIVSMNELEGIVLDGLVPEIENGEMSRE